MTDVEPEPTLVVSGRKLIAELPADLGISESCLRDWMAQADRAEGRRADGVTTADREEMVRLRGELRVAKPD